MAQGGVINNYPYIDQYNQGGANGVWSVGTLYFKGNPNLTWETSNSFNTGFDFSLWHGMFSEVLNTSCDRPTTCCSSSLPAYHQVILRYR